MAINTSKTYLLRAGELPASGTTDRVTITKGTSSIVIPKVFNWFGDINNVPQLRGDKEMLEATTLSDTQVKQIEGIFGASDLNFEVNMPSGSELDKLENESDNGVEYYWLVYISQLGRGYVWKGTMSFTPLEFAVNEVVRGQVTCGNTSGVFYVGQTPYGDKGASSGDTNASIALTTAGSGILGGVTLTATSYSATTPTT